jgi:hypothetical protein
MQSRLPSKRAAKESDMIRNVGKIDQYIRIVAGLAMIAFVFKDGTLGSTWPILLPIGAILLATAFFSLCPLYTLLGWNTARKTTRVS